MREKAELISKLEACCESEGELVRSIAASTNVYIWVTHLGEYIQISPKELRRASKDMRSEVAGQWLAEEFGGKPMFAIPEFDLLRGHFLSDEASQHRAQVAQGVAFIGEEHRELRDEGASD